MELKQKITEFNNLMKEISEEFTSIFKEGKEDDYKEDLIVMLKSLDNAQQTVKQAYTLFLSRNIKEN